MLGFDDNSCNSNSSFISNFQICIHINARTSRKRTKDRCEWLLGEAGGTYGIPWTATTARTRMKMRKRDNCRCGVTANGAKEWMGWTLVVCWGAGSISEC